MAKLINCGRCNGLTEEVTIQGKVTKNCKQCRDLHNSKRKPVLKCEKLPANNSFYKQDTVELEDELLEEEQEQEDERLDEREQDEDEPSNSKERTIKELLSDILNKLDKPQSVAQDNNNDNKLNEFIKQQDLKNQIIINKLDKLLQAIT